MPPSLLPCIHYTVSSPASPWALCLPSVGTPGRGTWSAPRLATPQPVASAGQAPHSPELRRAPAGLAPEVGSRAGPWAAPSSTGGLRGELRSTPGQREGRGAGTRRPGGGVGSAASAQATLQAGGSQMSPEEGRSKRRSRSRRRGRGRPGPEGERAGQRKIASAHCCQARSGAAPSRARWALGGRLGAVRPAARPRLQLTGMGGAGPAPRTSLSGFSPRGGNQRGAEGGAGCGLSDCVSLQTWSVRSTPPPCWEKAGRNPEASSSSPLQSGKVPETCALPSCVRTACSLPGR